MRGARGMARRCGRMWAACTPTLAAEAFLFGVHMSIRVAVVCAGVCVCAFGWWEMRVWRVVFLRVNIITRWHHDADKGIHVKGAQRRPLHFMILSCASTHARSFTGREREAHCSEAMFWRSCVVRGRLW